MRRAVCMGLATLTLVGLTACGSSSGSGNSSSSAGSTSSPSSSESSVASSSAAGSSTDSASTGSSSAGGSSAAAPTGDPIVIGVMVQETGPNSQSNAPAAPGAKAWEGWTNAHGGINGHPVKLEIVDSARTPAQAITQVQDLVSKKAVAIGAFLDSAVEGAIAPSIDAAKLPILGSSPSTSIWTTDPNYFPTGTNVTTQALTAIPEIAKADGVKVMGAVVCAEATVCKGIDQIFTPEAKTLGLTYVGAATAAASQPDFTAVCLQLQTKKVEFVDLELGSATSDTLVTNCSTQGFDPIYHYTYAAFSNSLLAHDGIKALGVQPVLPWYVTGNQAAADFRDAYKQYSGDTKDPEMPAMFSWTSLETLKAAIAASGVSGIPTSADVYKGLYALKNFTAGGLIPAAVHYVAGKPATPIACYFVAGVTDGKLSSPNGTGAICPAS